MAAPEARLWVDTATGQAVLHGLIDPEANKRAAVYREWSEEHGGGDVFEAMHEPTGFPNRTDTSISFNNGNRTLTVAPTGASFDIYIKGDKYTFTVSQTKQITDTEGTWWFYFDTSGVLTAAQTAPDLRDTAWVAIIYWDVTNSVALDLAEERHGTTMDGATHSLLHYTVGTRWESGLAAGDYTIAGDGSADADAQLSIADGVIDDEDLPVIITDDSPQNLAPIAWIPVYYLLGATPVWRKTGADAFPVIDNATDEIRYNLDTAGTWSNAIATNNYHVAMWIFATPNVAEPIIAVLGQRQDSKLGDAKENNLYESLVFNTLPFQEMKLLFRLIFNTRYPQHANTPHCKLVDIVDLRSVSNLPAGTYVATAHSSLTGRSDRYSHPASAVSVDLTNLDHLLSGLVAPTTDDVQAAMEVLDDVLENAQTVNADWTWSGTYKILFRDAAIHIQSATDGHLDLTADVSIDLNSAVAMNVATALCGFHFEPDIESVAWSDGNTRNTAAYFKKNITAASVPESLSGLFGADVYWTGGSNGENVNAMFFNLSLNGNATYAGGAQRGVVGSTTINSSGVAFTTSCVGMQGKLLIDGTYDSTMANAAGQIALEAWVSITGTDGGSIDKVVGLKTRGSFAGAATLADYYGIWVTDASGAVTPTNQIGVYVEDMTQGSGTDVGIRIDGADTYALWLGAGADNTGAADGVTFGASADTNLYRGAANQLKTDDDLLLGTTHKLILSDVAKYIQWDGSDLSYVTDAGTHKFTGDMLSHGSAKHFFDVSGAAGTEKIYSPADTILRLEAAAYVTIGTGTPTHLDVGNSFHVSGKFEVDDRAYFDTHIHAAAAILFSGTAPFLLFQDGATWACTLRPNYVYDQVAIGLESNVGRQLILTDQTHYASNFDHPVQDHPTLYGQGNFHPDVSNNYWWSITHDATGMLISTGPNVGAGSVPATIDNYISFAPRGTESFRLTGGGDALIPNSGKLHLDVGAAIGTEWVGSLADTYLDLAHGAGGGLRIRNENNLLLTVRRYSGGSPTDTRVEAPVSFNWYISGTQLNYMTASANMWQIPQKLDDNRVFGFGSGTAWYEPDWDAAIYYNATHLVIDPNIIGTGKVYIGATANDEAAAAKWHTTVAGTEYAGSDAAGYYDIHALTAARFNADIFMVDAKNIILDTTTGTELGTAAAQKLGFWGTAPVVQPAHVADADGTLAGNQAAINAILAQMAATGMQAAA